MVIDLGPTPSRELFISADQWMSSRTPWDPTQSITLKPLEELVGMLQRGAIVLDAPRMPSSSQKVLPYLHLSSKNDFEAEMKDILASLSFGQTDPLGTSADEISTTNAPVTDWTPLIASQAIMQRPL
jgi:hypothetical protein